MRISPSRTNASRSSTTTTRSMFIVFLVSASSYAGQPQPGTKTVESLLPPTTIVAGFMNDAEAYERASSALPLAKIMAEQEVVAFLEKPKKAIDAVFAKMEAKVREQEGFSDFQFNTKQMFEGAYGRTFVALTHFTMPTEPGSDPDVGLIVGLERKQGAPDWGRQIKDLVSRLANAGPGGEPAQFETVPVEGTGFSYEVLRGFDESNRAPVILAELEGLQLFSLSASSVIGVMSRAKGMITDSLATDARYLASQKEVGGSGVDSACVFVNLEQLIDLAVGGAKMGIAMSGSDPSYIELVDRVVDSSGIRAAKSLFMKSEARDGASHSTSFLAMEGERRGLFAAMRENSINPAHLKFIPDNAASFSIGSFDMAPLYDFVMGSLKEFHPETHDMVVSQLDALGKQVGGDENPINLRNDLFQNLGPSYYTLTPKKASMMTQVPPMLFAVEVRNPDRVVDSIRKIVEFAGTQMGSPMKVESEERKGYTLHEISLGGQLAIVRPAFTVAGGYLVLSTEPGLVKQHMKRLEKGDAADITSAPDYQRFAKHLPEKGVTSLAYGDTRYTFESLYDMFISTVPMFAQMSEVEIPIDFQIAPMRETISQHLFGDLSFSVDTPQGTRSESYGSIGAESASVVAGALMAAGVFAMAQEMEKSTMSPPSDAIGSSPTSARPESDDDRARSDLKLLSSNVVLYRLEKDALPASLDDLLAPLPSYPNGLLEGSALPLDPWGKPYLYRVDGKDYKIWTMGPDGVDNEGTGDDIMRSSAKN